MNIPELPKYVKDIEQLEKFYKKAFKRAVKLLEKVEPEELLKQEILEAQIRQLVFIIHELTGESQEWFETHLTIAYEQAQATALVTMGLAKDLVEAKGQLSHSLMSRQRIEAMISDSFEDVLKAHSQMEENLKQTVRDVQMEVMKQNVALQRGTVTSAKDMRAELLQQGFSKSLLEEDWKGITDAGGKRWDLTTYTKMVARTKLQQVQIEGAKQMSLENNTDLAMISSHGAKDACRHFEGMIVSLQGRTPGFPTLDQVRSSGLIFHPNCQHSVHPLGDLDALPQSLRDRASKALETAEHAMENAKEIKQEDNKRRYQQKKEKIERIKESRLKALEKARKARAEKRTR